MERVKRHLEEELRQIANKIRINAIKVIDREKMVVTGHLRNSIQTKITIKENDAYITVYVAEGGRIKGSTKYPKFLHEGIEPHMPPVDAIKEWVRKKGIAKKEIGLKKNMRGKSKQDIMEKKKGRKPTPFLDLAVKMTFNQLGVRS